MTLGAYGAITLAFSILLDPGDECIIPVPGWFLYETSLSLVHAVTVKVPLRNDDFDLDVDAIEAAITARTRIVVVNTPHNPTGVIYSPGEAGGTGGDAASEVGGIRTPDLHPVGRALPPDPVRRGGLYQPSRGLSLDPDRL